MTKASALRQTPLMPEGRIATPSATTVTTLIPKLERLIRQHRQRVFDPESGDAHTRAIHRLKSTATWAELKRLNEDAERQREDAKLERMGY